MLTGRHIDRVCVVSVILALAITILLMCSMNLRGANLSMGYENRIFDSSSVHKIDIVMDKWDDFIASCENEEYSSCAVVIDGEKYKNVGIRAKGNTSLSNVRDMGSQRYSFKLEFDKYEKGESYYGLDKICLNNLIQDNTMMKDYLVYKMMDDFGVDSPLCSYVYITVNGKDWGLYLAVEGVEDGFLKRSYGADAGNLYKPDSMDIGGGGKNTGALGAQPSDTSPEAPKEPGQPSNADAATSGDIPGSSQGGSQPSNAAPPQAGAIPGNPQGGSKPDGENLQKGSQSANAVPLQADALPENSQESSQGETMQNGAAPQPPGEGEGFGGGRPSGEARGAMGSDDVKLKYIDDNPDSYKNIFDNAKTDISEADKSRFISSLKNLSQYTALEDTLDMDKVIRYFVVHNFVCNGDSYTGSMIHNYYIHEKDGKLAMIPWDYNLAFGAFQKNNADSVINESIDNPISGGNVDDRPMFGWIFSDSAYTDKYHTMFSEFTQQWLESDRLSLMIKDTSNLIHDYVDKDPSKFCTLEEYEKGVSTLSEFVTLRAKAVKSQLEGDTKTTVASDVNISDMGSMNNKSPDKDRQTGEMPGGDRPKPDQKNETNTENSMILLCSSVICLLAGLAIAFKFKS